MPLMRIPYTAPLPDPTIIPASATNLPGAIAALHDFLTAPSLHKKNGKTVLLTGAGISVASGLADYRGTAGTYTLNKTYRPVYFHEFCASHEARKRYWARSYLGWTNLNRAKPNAAHLAVARLGEMGQISSVITQSMVFSTMRTESTSADRHRRGLFPSPSPPFPTDTRATWISSQRSMPLLSYRIRS